MGKYVFKLPDVGEGTAEAEIAAWHVKVGDKVDEDQPMIDVMTDKATVEIPTPTAGTVLSITGDSSFHWPASKYRPASARPHSTCSGSSAIAAA